MTARISDRGIIGEERQFVLALGADDVSGNGQAIPLATLHDRHGRAIVGLQEFDCRFQSDAFHGLRLACERPKWKEAASAKGRLKFRPATGQVNEEHAGYSRRR